MSDLREQVCVITGCARGIGRALADGFVRRGARVIATSRQAPAVAGAVENLAWDVSDAEAAGPIIQGVVSRHGRLDAFIANAGQDPAVPWDELTPTQWRDIMAANLDGAWFGAQSAAKVMVKQGHGKIVLVGSILSELGGDGSRPHYISAKAGLIGLTRSLARGLGPKGVRVNMVMVGAVRTDAESRKFPDEAAVNAILARQQCVPDRIRVDDLVPTFAFLCSSDSDPIVGQVICADHGYVHY